MPESAEPAAEPNKNDVINVVNKLSHNDIRCYVKYAVWDSPLLPLNHLLFIFDHTHKKMGNCLPKLKKKNKVSFTVKVKTETERTVSEVLSRSSSSVSLPSLSSDENITMVKAFKLSSDDDTPVESRSLRTEGNITDELRDIGNISLIDLFIYL